MKTLPLMLAAGLALAPAAALAQPTATYLRDAGASDLFERQSATVALQGTRNADVRRFAQMMIRDHTNSTNMVKNAARQSRVMVGTPHLNADQSRMLSELRRARGGERDQLYVQQQRMSHDAALQVQQDYASTGSAAPLRRTAGMIVPVVQHHIEMLQNMGDGNMPMGRDGAMRHDDGGAPMGHRM